MPSELIVADYQFDMDGVLYGAGQTWDNDPQGWSGVAGLQVSADGDTDYRLADGGVAGVHTMPSRLISFPLQAFGLDSELMPAAEELEAAWSARNADVDLFWRLPGIGQRSVSGRPLGAVIDLGLLPQGMVRALCTFRAYLPTVTDEEVESA